MGRVLKALARHVTVPDRLVRPVAEGVASILDRDADPRTWSLEALEATDEHPWAFHQIQALGEELTIVEVGGGDPGLRSTLARAGHRVITMGAGVAAAGAAGAAGTVVALRPEATGLSDIPAGSVDVFVSIRGLEHLADAEAAAVMEAARRMLGPGGHLVLATGGTGVQSMLDALDAELVTVERVGRRGFAVLDAAALGTRSAEGRCVVARKR
jgi:2-polyprenyl-3-methyl-5-hydroxy-6-metoxy-1,4-benzoquinol methylase